MQEKTAKLFGEAIAIALWGMLRVLPVHLSQADINSTGMYNGLFLITMWMIHASKSDRWRSPVIMAVLIIYFFNVILTGGYLSINRLLP